MAKKETKKKEYVPKETTKVGDLVGKVYDINDSPVAEITKTKKGFKFTSKKTGKSVECENIRKLVEKDYLAVTNGVKYVYIRWKWTKNFRITDFTKQWVDKKLHWCSENFPDIS